MHKALKIYQKRLTNLSSRNRSLLLLKIVKSQFIDLHRFDYIENKPSFDVIEQLISGKQTYKLCSAIDSRDKDANALSHQLRTISRTDQRIYEEQGAKDLYIGYPFVHGRLLDDTLVRCPLLFFPVSLDVARNQWVLQARRDVDISFNKTLLLAFSHFNNVIFEDSFLEYDFSEHAQDSQDFRTELYRLLQSSPLELNFNPDTFEDTLTGFRDFTKEQFKLETETGRLKLFQEAVLGIFPQAGSYLMPNYEFLLKNEPEKDIEDFFVSANKRHLVSVGQPAKAIKEEDVVMPYQLDGSQEEAVKAIKTGESLVVQGPPGSGKSQLICNLIVDAMASGKNVLLVCQKKAALDVVYQRLAEKGFQDFAALVHDFKNDRREIYGKINTQIEKLDVFKRENNSLDAIVLERNFLKLSREIDMITEELEEFRKALFDTSECGLSVKELYLTSDLNMSGISLRREYEHFHFAHYSTYMQHFKRYFKYHHRFEAQHYPWADRVSFKDFTVAEYQHIRELAQGLKAKFDNSVESVKSLLNMQLSFQDFEWIDDRRQKFADLLEVLKNPTVFRYFKIGLRFQTPEYVWLANRKKNLLSSFGAEGIESSLDKHEIGEVQALLLEALAAQRNWYERLKWRLFSKNRIRVASLLKKNKLEGHKQALELLVRRIDNRMNLEHHLSTLGQYKWLIDMPQETDLYALRDWLDLHLQALEARKIYQSLRNGIRYLNLEDFSYDEIVKKINALLGVVTEVKQDRQHWLQYLSRKQIEALIEENMTPEMLNSALERDFDALVAYDQLKETLNAPEKTLLDRFQEKFGKLPPEQALKQIDNSIRIAWINHIETKYPVLRSVSSERLEELEERLQEATREKRTISQQIALIKTRERTYAEVEYNRLNNMVTYRDLKHQVSKKRNIWPIRKLIQYHSHEFQNLLPCWMGSPESVSAIFPMEEFFDLVIFDEASQCFAEKGIPAMYRGKQVVITGDDQQLPPFDLYVPRWEEALETDPTLEVDSLLDLGKQFLREVPLNGHYRSKSLDLIDFSNRHFYGQRLQLVPHHTQFMEAAPAIAYEQVNGVWEHNTNPEEARKVVEIVRDLTQGGEENIGIITFNFKQQDLIQDLLDEADFNLPPSVFVKNIENVQGDERNVIIFSVGYAPSPSGKMNFQFGSLNQLKGENRLNVAITRAKSKIILVTSIKPSALKVEQAKNEGPKLLKAYLQYAYEVAENKYRPTLMAPAPYGQHWFLTEQIKRLGEQFEMAFEQHLPFADLDLRHGQHHLLLLTDDNTYYQSTSVKDAHVYRPFQLREKDWTFKRFYSRHFWKSPENFAKGVYNFVERDEGVGEPK